jgi:hypothetical protein
LSELGGKKVKIHFKLNIFLVRTMCQERYSQYLHKQNQEEEYCNIQFILPGTGTRLYWLKENSAPVKGIRN